MAVRFSQNSKGVKMDCPNCKKSCRDFDVDDRTILYCSTCGWFEKQSDGGYKIIEPMPELLQPPDLDPDPETNSRICVNREQPTDQTPGTELSESESVERIEGPESVVHDSDKNEDSDFGVSITFEDE